MKKRPIGTLPNFNEIYSTERKPMDYGGGVTLPNFNETNIIERKIVVDRYEGDDFVREGLRNWSDPMNKYVDDEVQINTDTQGQYDTNPKQKKNKIFALLAGVAAAYFLLK